ncbi:MAG: anti-sigma-factor antagonist [Candidatus Solibacter sp.]|jgi:anti-anti-sigma factor|nr:anti-sigma-factor antagonist [Candidatus Solibacter sp.]
MIQLTEETRAGWCIVGVRGRVDAESADELEAALRAAIGANGKVAANFAGVDYVSSAGLRAVIQAARAAQGKSVEFTICSMNAHVKKVFDMSGLHQILHIQGELPC